jgi:alginate O-acetyltransferase complex protein AlgJ
MLRYPIFTALFAHATAIIAAPLPPLPTPPVDLKSAGFEATPGWFFLSAELNHLRSDASPATLSGEKNPIPAILAFHQALAAKGIRLYILPVPEKSLIRADQLFPADHTTAAAGYAQVTDRFIDALKASGVSVIESRDLLSKAAANATPKADPVYCRTDSHFTPATGAILATTIAAQLRKDLPELTGPANSYAPIAGPATTITIQGDLAPAGTSESLTFIPVLPLAGSPPPATTDSTKPVLLLGDSHCLIFHSGGDMLAKNGGLPDHLGAALGFMPDVMAVRGSGATSARINLYRKARKDPSYLAGKKAVVWCFAAREFTQADAWKTVPLP